MKQDLLYLLGLKEIKIKGVLRPELIDGKQTGVFVQISAYDHFFERLHDNQISKINGKDRNIAILEEFEESVVYFIKNEFKIRYDKDLEV